MLRRCLQLHLSLIVLADQTPRKAWPFRPPPGDGFGLDGDPVSEGLLLMDVSLIVAERGVQIVARQGWQAACDAGAPHAGSVPGQLHPGCRDRRRQEGAVVPVGADEE